MMLYKVVGSFYLINFQIISPTYVWHHLASLLPPWLSKSIKII